MVKNEKVVRLLVVVQDVDDMEGLLQSLTQCVLDWSNDGGNILRYAIRTDNDLEEGFSKEADEKGDDCK